jgi:hypothetical protein
MEQGDSATISLRFIPSLSMAADAFFGMSFETTRSMLSGIVIFVSGLKTPDLKIQILKSA